MRRIKFKERFETPFEQYSEHNGKRFKPIRRLDDSERDRCVGRMWKIELETGEVIDAWQEEVEEGRRFVY
ncbi:MAG: hypothetical protein AB1330_00970 [Bacillota bacterium]